MESGISVYMLVSVPQTHLSRMLNFVFKIPAVGSRYAEWYPVFIQSFMLFPDVWSDNDTSG